MRCHYEVLNVSRDATFDEIKKAYKKLAIKCHPDKNLDNIEEATEQFQFIQQSFEVLSDPHERAWYDDHRDAILRGKVGSEYEDDSLDVYQYFTPSCYKGFGDDANGFYSVYREVFYKIAAEDPEYQTEGDSDFDIPNFGKSNSSFEEVKYFYDYWQSYCTKKSYSWLDPYDVRTAPNRKVAKIIEKENKKARDKARKTRNEEVRELVNFVRKRDKRVQAHAQYLQELSAEKAKKSEEKRREKIKERKAEIASHKECEWARFSNLEKELKVIEANLASEFGEEVFDENSEDEENETDKDQNLYCIACNKLFKTTKAFQNHESSKKHKENIQILKETLQDSSDDTDLKSDSELEEEYNEITQENYFDEEILSDVEIINNSNTDENEDKANSLYCKPCEKSFKTLKAIKNHKLSKKHIINEKLYDDTIQEILNSTLTSEEETNDEFDVNDSKRKSSDENLYKEEISVNDGEFMKDIENICAEIDELSKTVIDEENIKRLCDEWDEIINGDSEEELSPMQDSDFLDDEGISSIENLLESDKKDGKTLNKSYKKKPTKGSIFTKFEDDDDFDFSSRQSKKQKKKSKNKQQIVQKNKETLSNSVDDVSENNFDGKSNLNKENQYSCEKCTEDSHSISKEMKSNKTLKHTAAPSNVNTGKVKKQNKNNISASSLIDTSSSCVICKATFPSKNKLFQHLSDTGHSVFIPEKSNSHKEADRESSKKSKTKRNKK